MPQVSKAMVDQLVADVKAELPPGTVFSFPLLTVFLTRCHQIFGWVAGVAARGGPARQGGSISELGLWGHILDEFLPFISDDGGGDSREMFETLRYAASARCLARPSRPIPCLICWSFCFSMRSIAHYHCTS